MTVNSEATSAGPYTPNGSTTVFPFSFAARAAADVQVLLDGVILNPALYDVTLSADFNSGSVTFTTAPTGLALYVYSDPAFEQATSLGNQAAYFPKVIEASFDKSAIRDLVLKEEVGRSLRLPFGSEPAAPLIGPGYVTISPDGSVSIVPGAGELTEASLATVASMIASAGVTINNTIASLTTSNITEGSGLYFTTARARAAFSGSSSVTLNSATGQITVSKANLDAAAGFTLYQLQGSSTATINNGAVSVTAGNITAALGVAPLLLSGGTLTGPLLLPANPTDPLGAATKQYVDNLSAGRQPKPSVVAASTGNLTLYGTQTVDGVALVVGNRFLAKDQTAPATNGIWIVQSADWTRPADMDAWTEVPNAVCVVTGGTVNAATSWIVSGAPLSGAVGTTAITFVLDGAQPNYTATGGITKTSLQFSLTPIATATFLGNVSGSTAAPTALSVSSVKTALSLDQVNNTTDANKPISTATATALAGKASTGANTFSGNQTAAAFVAPSIGGTAGGIAIVQNASSTQSGYLNIILPSGAQAGYIGFATSTGPIAYGNSLGMGHSFTGGAVSSDTDPSSAAHLIRLSWLQSAAGAQNVGRKATSAAILVALSNWSKDMFELRGYVTEATVAGGADIAPYIASMAGDISSNGGGVGYLMPKELYIDTEITMPANVTLDGRSNEEDTRTGCRLYRDSTTVRPFVFPFDHFGGGMRNMLFIEAQPNLNHGVLTGTPGGGWAPTVYVPWIKMEGGQGAKFDNLLFRGCYAWMKFGDDSYNVGRVDLKNIRGQTLGTAFDFANCQDTMRMNGTHIWPYAYGEDPDVTAYLYANAKNIRWGRCDNPMVSNSFLSGAARAMDFYQAANGKTTNGMFFNIDTDFSAIGVYQGASDAHNRFANWTTQPTPGGSTVEYGLYVDAAVSNCVLNLNGCSIAHTGNENIRINGTNNQVTFAGGNIGTWNENGTSSGYGIYAASGNTAKIVATCADVPGTGSIGNWGGPGTIIQAGN